MPIGYWESETLLKPVDLTIIGAGIVGMSTALHVRRARPDWTLRIVERSPLSAGGTTRNAGFACFGGAGEWLDDLESLGPEGLKALVRQRAEGLRALIELLGAEAIGLQWTGGHELFGEEDVDQRAAHRARAALQELNLIVQPVLSSTLGTLRPDLSPSTPALIEDADRASALGAAVAISLPWEGMIHTGRMVEAFHRRLDEAGIQRLHGLTLQSLSERKEGWSLETNHGLLNSTRVALCTNGLAKDMLPELDVAPVPNRVLVCRPATPSLKEGTYHLDRGYLYMRTLPDGLVLFGGGRHWGHALPLPPMQDLEAEQAWDQQLEAEARRWLGPIEAVTHRWTGWLGVGSARSPLLAQPRPGLHHAVRLGGMGVAIGCGLGAQLADKLLTGALDRGSPEG